MSKKLITLLLLTVFMLAQFSSASATPSTSMLDGTTTLGTLPRFNDGIDINLDQSIVEFKLTVDDSLDCASTPSIPDPSSPVNGNTFIDSYNPTGLMANPPTLVIVNELWEYRVSCNTFEMWALVTDNFLRSPIYGYSGMASWNQSVTGASAPPASLVPAPIGPVEDLLSWPYTFPSTASGP